MLDISNYKNILYKACMRVTSTYDYFNSLSTTELRTRTRKLKNKSKMTRQQLIDNLVSMADQEHIKYLNLTCIHSLTYVLEECVNDKSKKLG
jgi:hypothetical protein